VFEIFRPYLSSYSLLDQKAGELSQKIIQIAFKALGKRGGTYAQNE